MTVSLHIKYYQEFVLVNLAQLVGTMHNIIYARSGVQTPTTTKKHYQELAKRQALTCQSF